MNFLDLRGKNGIQLLKTVAKFLYKNKQQQCIGSLIRILYINYLSKVCLINCSKKYDFIFLIQQLQLCPAKNHYFILCMCVA